MNEQIQPPMAIQQQMPQVGVSELPPEVMLMLDLYSESNRLVLLCMEIDEDDIKRKKSLGDLREQCKTVSKLVLEFDNLIRKKAEEMRKRKAQQQFAQVPYRQETSSM